MLRIILHAFASAFRSRRQLAPDSLALHHQLEVLQRTAKRPKLTPTDRTLLVWVSRSLDNWKQHLTIVQPETVVGWHRLGWRLYWRRKSRKRRPGRPCVEAEIRALIRRLSIENPLWGAPRVHGELLKLGHDVAETTVGKYMAKRSGPPLQSWRTFLRNHATEIVAIDFLTVPTATLRILYVFVVLSLNRRRIVHFNVTDPPSAAWTGLQLIQAFPFDTAPRYVIRDRDDIYGEMVVATLRALGIEEKTIGDPSPWRRGLPAPPQSRRFRPSLFMVPPNPLRAHPNDAKTYT